MLEAGGWGMEARGWRPEVGGWMPEVGGKPIDVKNEINIQLRALLQQYYPEQTNKRRAETHSEVPTCNRRIEVELPLTPCGGASTRVQVAAEGALRAAELDAWISQPLQDEDIEAIVAASDASKIADPRPLFDLGVLEPPPLHIDDEGVLTWSATRCKRFLLAEDSEKWWPRVCIDSECQLVLRSLGLMLQKQGAAEGTQLPKMRVQVGLLTRAQVLGRGHFEVSQQMWSNDLGVMAAKYRYCPRLEAKVIVNLLGAWSIADVDLNGRLTQQLTDWGAQNLNDLERESLQIVYDSGCILDQAGFLADSGIL